MSAWTGAHRPAPNEVAYVEPLGDELVVWEPRTEQLHHLDVLATAVWLRLDGEASVDELAEEFAGLTGASADVVRADLLVLCARLAEAGLVEDPR